MSLRVSLRHNVLNGIHFVQSKHNGRKKCMLIRTPSDFAKK